MEVSDTDFIQTDELEIDRVTNELSQLTRDIELFRNYDIRHQERRTNNPKKREYMNHESNNYVLESMVKLSDWEGVIREVGLYGFSRNDIIRITDIAIEHLFRGDVKELGLMFQTLNYRRYVNNPEPGEGNSIIDSKIKKSDPKTQNIIDFDSKFDINAINAGLNIIECAATDPKKAQEDFLEYFSPKNEGVKIYVERIIKKEFDKVSESEKESQRRLLTSKTYTRIHAEIRQYLIRMISNTFYGLGSGSNPIPEVKSDTMTSLLREKNWNSYSTEIKEDIKSSMLVNINTDSYTQESLMVLAHIDPSLALSEATVFGNRNEIIYEVASFAPEDIIQAIREGSISAEERLVFIHSLVELNPHYLLHHYQEIDVPSLKIEEFLKASIFKEDIFSLIQVSETDGYLKTIISEQQNQEFIKSQLMEIFKNQSGKDIILFHLYYSGSGLPIFSDPEYLSLITNSLDNLGSEFMSKVKKVGSPLDPGFLEDIKYSFKRDSRGEKYNSIRDNHFKFLPPQLQTFIPLYSFVEAGQSEEVCAQIIDNRMDIGGRNIFAIHLSQNLNTIFFDKCESSWGMSVNLLSLVNKETVALMSEDKKIQLSEFVINLLENFDQETEDFFVPEDWGDGENVDDVHNYIYKHLALFSTSLTELKNPEIRRLMIELAAKDNAFLEGFSYINGDEFYGDHFFTEVEKSYIIEMKDSVEGRVKAIDFFKEKQNQRFVQHCFEKAMVDFPVLVPFNNYQHYRRCRDFAGEFDFNIETVNGIVSLEKLLDEKDLHLLSKGRMVDRSDIMRFVSHVLIAKNIESLGIEKEPAFLWSDTASELYLDPGYLYSLSPDKRREVADVYRFIELHRRKILTKLMDIDVNWLETAPKFLDLLIGSEPKDFEEVVSVLGKKLELEQVNQDKLLGLFRLKDLRLGKFSRRIIVGNIINLSKSDDGVEVVKSILDSTHLSKDDPKRLRNIFRLGEIVRISSRLFESRDLGHAKDAILKLASDKILSTFGFDSESNSKFSANVERLQNSGLFGAYVALKDRYGRNKYPRSLRALNEVYQHILEGDFSDYRKNNPLASEIIHDVSHEQTQNWHQPSQEITMNGYLYSFKDMEFASRSLAQESISHLQKISEDSYERRYRKSQGLIDNIRFVFGTFRKIKEGDFDADDVRDISERCLKTISILSGLGETQSANDVRQIIKVLNTEIDDSKKVIFHSKDSDDIVDLFNSGLYPQETCQSWRDGLYNECLLSTVSDPYTRIINVLDHNQNIVGRSLIKLRSIQKMKKTVDSEAASDGNPINTILVETVYAHKSTSTVKSVIFATAVEKAIACKLPLLIGNSHSVSKSDVEYIQSKGGKISIIPVKLVKDVVTGDRAYSDTFGGKINPESEYIDSGGDVMLISFEDYESTA